MLKRCFILIVVFCFFFSLASCGLDYRYALEEDLHNQTALIWYDTDPDPSHVIYKDQKYMLNKNKFISVDTSLDNRIRISWVGYRYWGYIDEYHSYTTENPMYIYYYDGQWVFLREDYDYSTDDWKIENSSSIINWTDIFGFKQSAINIAPQFEITLFSNQCSGIEATIEMTFIENQWYLSLPGCQEVWAPSDEFIEILSDNGIITT